MVVDKHREATSGVVTLRVFLGADIAGLDEAAKVWRVAENIFSVVAVPV